MNKLQLKEDWNVIKGKLKSLRRIESRIQKRLNKAKEEVERLLEECSGKRV